MRTNEKRKEMKQRLGKQFLEKPANCQIYNRYIKTKDPYLLHQLNQDYSNFVNYIRLLSLIKTHVKYKSLHVRERYQIYKQELISEDTLEYEINRKEASKLELPLTQWDAALESEDMVKAVSTLSERQQQIVWFLFVEDIPVTEIKKKLKVSQQAISKTKKRALQKIEEQLKEGGETLK